MWCQKIQSFWVCVCLHLGICGNCCSHGTAANKFLYVHVCIWMCVCDSASIHINSSLFVFFHQPHPPPHKKNSWDRSHKDKQKVKTLMHIEEGAGLGWVVSPAQQECLIDSPAAEPPSGYTERHRLPDSTGPWSTVQSVLSPSTLNRIALIVLWRASPEKR